MIHRLQEFLRKEKNLYTIYQNQIIHCDITSDGVSVLSASGSVYQSYKVIICNGSDFKSLYPELFANSGLEVTKLQIIQTVPQPSQYILPRSILTGQSIRRYESFHECPSYLEIKKKEDPNSLEKKWGVHILFKQATDGSVIIGDSHQYADDLGFDLQQNINDFIKH